jgi:hypothetical protein
MSVARATAPRERAHRLLRRKLSAFYAHSEERSGDWRARFEFVLDHASAACVGQCDASVSLTHQRPFDSGLPRYVLLLKDLLKHTPTEHVDYALIERALEEVQAFATRVDQFKASSVRGVVGSVRACGGWVGVRALTARARVCVRVGHAATPREALWSAVASGWSPVGDAARVDARADDWEEDEA